MSRLSWFAAIGFGVCLGACGGGAIGLGDGSLDSGASSPAAADSGAVDSGPADSGPGAADSGAANSGAADSGAADSGAADSGAADSGAPDAGAADSGAAGSGAPDAGAADAGATGSGSPDGGWALIWSDEFNGPDGSGLDSSRWVYETGGGGWGNGEAENYTARTDNVVQEGGHLDLIARHESSGGSSYTSGRIKTAGKFSFRYGRIEMSAKLPQGQGIWPAFWMLGANLDTTPWPGCGELDIMEFVGSRPDRIYGTIHGPGYSGAGGIGAWHQRAQGFSDGFHTYAVEWDPEAIRWYFDGELYELRTRVDLGTHSWVFDHDFFVVLNLAVGGAWPGPPDATTIFPQSYSVDYVRVFQRTAPAPLLAPRTVISVQAQVNGKFVSADPTDADRLSANRQTADRWEWFEVEELGGGEISLRSLQNYKYASAGPSCAGALVANAETRGPGETFLRADSSGGSATLRCSGNGLLVSVDAASGHLAATGTAASPAQLFQLIPH